MPWTPWPHGLTFKVDWRPMIVAASVGFYAGIEGERKIVTALFADLKGSTELEQDLDPEDARVIVDPGATSTLGADPGGDEAATAPHHLSIRTVHRGSANADTSISIVAAIFRVRAVTDRGTGQGERDLDTDVAGRAGGGRGLTSLRVQIDCAPPSSLRIRDLPSKLDRSLRCQTVGGMRDCRGSKNGNSN